MMEQQIIAIGGGGFTSPDTQLKMERYLLAQTKKTQPKICFLPQASAENSEYIVKFFSAFTELGAIPSWVSLFGRVESSWQEKLLSQDLIYVGGGNTRSMIALWKEWGADKVLKKAYEQGIVLCGVSAGAICWFEEMITDSVWPLGAIKGLKLLPGSCCPHYDSEPERRPTYLEKVNKSEVIPGIALEDHTAAHYVNSNLKCIAITDPKRNAYYVSKTGEKKIEQTLFL